jgi:hypothetical protein
MPMDFCSRLVRSKDGEAAIRQRCQIRGKREKGRVDNDVCTTTMVHSDLRRGVFVTPFLDMALISPATFMRLPMVMFVLCVSCDIAADKTLCYQSDALGPHSRIKK